ncbi:MAG: NADH-quinone oxidoreductase subunit NuoE [Dehalococcoidales bacterium]|nr:NADH-quinone oxidoreductase subunit NuoE [Dehalococcoidales bacterium]
METDIREQLDELFSPYSGERSDLIPILQKVQEKFGYLPREAMRKIAKFLSLPESTVYGVSTFYAQFKFVPTGKRIVKVCRGTACHVRGGARILREVEKQLGIKPGETTSDMEYTLETVACIGACALAPTMVVDKETQRKMTPQKVAELFSNISKAGENVS